MARLINPKMHEFDECVIIVGLMREAHGPDRLGAQEVGNDTESVVVQRSGETEREFLDRARSHFLSH